MLNYLLPLIGLFFILCSILFLFDNKSQHPSLYTLIPVTGVCLIIWFSKKDEVVTKILSSKLFVGIGLISYSLYLWHFPIFAFDRITEFSQNNLIIKLVFGIVVLVLSIFTYYYVEQPSRNLKNSSKILKTI